MVNGICHWSERQVIERKALSFADLTVYRVPVTLNPSSPDPVAALQVALTQRDIHPHRQKSCGSTHHHLVSLFQGSDGLAFAEIEVEVNHGE